MDTVGRSPGLLGDLNYNDRIDPDDVDRFVHSLSALSAGTPVVAAFFNSRADANEDGLFNTLDVGPFIDILLDNGVTPVTIERAFDEIPEPATAVIVVTVAFGLLTRRPRM